VGDDSSSWSPPDLSHVWKHLADHGYAVIEDWSIGLTGDFLTKFHKKYFTDRKLRHDEGDWPRDRKRARDVIHYTWAGTRLRLREYVTIALIDRAGIKGTRVHKRVRVLADPMAEHLVRTLLCLVPPARRKPEGTFGINFFRTFTDVVTKPHHDGEQFIILYVMHRKGDGAKSYLYRVPENPGSDGPDDESPGELVLDLQLNPGELLIFEDKLFQHGATPLTSSSDGTAMRDVVVCTIDNDDTYLKSPRTGESVVVKTELATAGIRD
jgi:2OG-Fe dioxygenase